MNRRSGLTRIALALPLALAAPLLVSAPATAGDGDGDEKQQPTYDYGAKVSIELRMEDGTLVKHRGVLRSFGNEWRFEFEGAGHKHTVVLNAESEEGQKTLEVTFAYDRDGTTVMAPYTTTYVARKRQSLWTHDGKIALALTFTPTRFEREDKSRDDKQKVKPDDNDDPLGGPLF